MITTPEDLLKIVCYVMGIEPEKLKVPNRKKEYVKTRFLFFHIGSHELKFTLLRMGQVFGMDHTSVIHGKRYIQNLIDLDDQTTLTQLTKIKSMCGLEAKKRTRLETAYDKLLLENIALKRQNNILKNKVASFQLQTFSEVNHN